MKIGSAVLMLLTFLCMFDMHSQERLNENSCFQQKIKFDYPLSKDEAISVFLKNNKLSEQSSFVVNVENTDKSGMVHIRHQQYYKGIKVQFGTLITHCIDNKVVSINSEVYNPNLISSIPLLNANVCFQRALDDCGAQKYLWDDVNQSEIVQYEKPKGELVFFPVVKTGEIKLAFKYDIYALEPLSRNEVFIDANDGTVIYKNPIIKHADENHINKSDFVDRSDKSCEALITGNANTKYSGLRSIETIFNSSLNKYILNDMTRGAQIITYNCQNIVNTYQNVNFTDNDNNWTTAEFANTNYDNAALDAHWASEMTYDFWKVNFNRNGYDDNNGLIKSYIHYRPTSGTYSNAFWNGLFMSYGDGVTKPFTSIDVCGHEIGHGVCQYTVDLAYQNQSGAMNEGYSDIWGACIEHFGRTGSMSGTPVTNVWIIGEDIVAGGLRSMSAPLAKGDPDTFRGTNWVVTSDDGTCTPTSSNDHCGVHTNSGVLNRWFYVLTSGASGTNNAPIAERDTYSVTGIGMQKAAEIAYLTERDYLTPNSTYFDARDNTIQVAKNLYCASSPEVVAVTNSWFSVNVGDSFFSYAIDASIKNIPVTSSLSCSSTNTYSTIVSFDNLGSTSITNATVVYNIDGGANSSSVWSGNIVTCGTANIPISLNIGSLSKGTHTLNVTLNVTGDGYTLNNSKSGVIFVNTPTNLNQVNTFEASNDVLVSYDEVGTNNVWERGTSLKPNLTNVVAGNSQVYATKLAEYYPPNMKSYLVSQCYDLSQTASPILKFDMAFDMVYASDILYMQYSTNGGSSWNLLGSNSDVNWYTENSLCQNCIGGEWTGEADITNSTGFTNGTKRQYSYNLSAFGAASASPQSNMMFRFVFQSDSLDELDGAIIDNFVLEGSLGLNQSVFNGLNIFPNPSKNQITVSFNSNSNDKIALSLFDIQGRLINTYSYEAEIGVFNKSLDISSIPDGFYLLKINQGNLDYNTKIIKQ